jgi:hypothetical protein
MLDREPIEATISFEVDMASGTANYVMCGGSNVFAVIKLEI